jgi:hypothetical protein
MKNEAANGAKNGERIGKKSATEAIKSLANSPSKTARTDVREETGRA